MGKPKMYNSNLHRAPFHVHDGNKIVLLKQLERQEAILYAMLETQKAILEATCQSYEIETPVIVKIESVPECTDPDVVPIGIIRTIKNKILGGK